MKGKISDTHIFLLCLVLGVGLFLVVYFVPFKNVGDQINAYESQNREIRNHISSLQEYYDNRVQYENDTEVLRKEVANLLASFPGAYGFEDYIMQAVNIEKKAPIRYERIDFEEVEDLATIPSDTIKKAEIPEYQSDVVFKRQNVVYTNIVDYFTLKNVIAQVFSSPYSVNLQSFTYNSEQVTGELKGSFKLGFYAVDGIGKEWVEPEIPEYEAGTTNIFGPYAPIGANGESEDNGGAQESNTGVSVDNNSVDNSSTDTNSSTTEGTPSESTSSSEGSTASGTEQVNGSTSTDVTNNSSSEGGFFDSLTDGN